MSARSYLSIGEVLTLLRQEFPDITISKIRFLESQGLVDPERTPSGYRKFYEHDVERLRWVLRQQREHFLPLKVIKDRLDDGSAETETDGRCGVGVHPGPDPGRRHRTRPPRATRTAPRRPRQSPRRGPGPGGPAGSGAEAESRLRPPAGEAPLSLVGDGPLLPGLVTPRAEATGRRRRSARDPDPAGRPRPRTAGRRPDAGARAGR